MQKKLRIKKQIKNFKKRRKLNKTIKRKNKKLLKNINKKNTIEKSKKKYI